METIFDRVDKLRKDKGLSVLELTRQAELSEKYIQQLKRYPNRNMGPDIALRIAKALGVSPQLVLFGDGQSPSEVKISDTAPTYPAQLNKDVPVFGTAAASHNGGAFQLDTGVIDYVRRPPALEAAKDIYALYVEGSSMEPQYWPGDLIFVHPHKPARNGDAIIIQEFNAQAQEITAKIGILLHRNGEHITIKKHNPSAEINIKRSNIKELHKVLSNNELYGV